MSDLVGRGSRLAMAASQGLRRLTGTSFFGPMCSPSRAHDAAAMETPHTPHVGFKVSVARRLVDDRPWHAPDRGSAALRCRSLQIRQNTTPLRALSGRSGASPYQRWATTAEPSSQRPQHCRQIHDRLIFPNTIAALGQQSSLNRSQIIQVQHLLTDRVDQNFAKLKEKRQRL